MMMSFLHSFNMLVTLLLAVVVTVITVIRLNGHVNILSNKRARLKYIMVINAVLVSAFQPCLPAVFNGLGEVLLSLSILWLLIDGVCPFSEYLNKNAHVHKDAQKQELEKSGDNA